MSNLFNTKLKTHQTVMIVSVIVFFTEVLFGFIFYTPILRSIVKSQKALKSGNEMRDFYLKLPMPLDFRVYFFNISNPLEVQEGQKPVLKEVGPYCYDAFKEKIIVGEDKEDDTLTYTPYDTYFFNETRSGDLSQDDYVTILNPLVVGIINTVASQKPQFLSAINKALPNIFKEDYNLYLTTRVRDILFDGIKVDCRVKDFTSTAVCSQFKGQSAMKEIEKSVYMFSIFGARNGSNPQQITVHRGIKDGNALGNVIAIDNQPNLTIWSGKCNQFSGTDGWIFPSFIKNDLWIMAPDLCRKFKAKYINDLYFHGVKVKKYFTVFGDSSKEEDNCYCNTPDTCLPKGVIDLTKCLQVPILCTLPHFLETDPKLIEQVEGLHPDTEKHIIKILFEPVTGTPMLGQRRIQFNLDVKPLKKIAIMKTVPEVLHPIFWLEEGVELEGYLLNKIITIHSLLVVMSVGRFIILAASIGFFAWGVYETHKEMKLSKVEPVEEFHPEKEKTNVKPLTPFSFKDEEIKETNNKVKQI